MASEDGIYKKTYREKTMQLHNESNVIKKAQLMREIANITFQQSLLKNKSSQTPLMFLQKNLQSYRDHMHNGAATSPSPMDIIQQECDNLLATSSDNQKLPNQEYMPTNLDRFSRVFNKPLPCQGKFLQCEHDEVTDTDVKLLFDKKTTSTESRIDRLPIPRINQRMPGVVVQPDANPDSAFTKKTTVTSNRRQQIDDEQNLLKQWYNQAASSRLKLTKYEDPQPVSKWMKTDCNERLTSPPIAHNVFTTARQELVVSHAKRIGYTARLPEPANTSETQQNSIDNRGSVRGKYVPVLQKVHHNPPYKDSCLASDDVEMQDDRLRNIDPKMVALIKNEIMEHQSSVGWNDIAGLEFAKSIIKEAVVLPLLRPDIFTGLRQPPRGILLFGPPGTGKTLIGKCIASQSKSTFFSISASSLTSKWIGDGEKMVRALFAVASVHQPAVVFIDEIDSLLCQRSETEHESSRRLKTEFLVQLDGAATNDTERILIVGATNRPQELDEAARRRLVKRLYIPLPELDARVHILQNLLTNQTDVTDVQMTEIGRLTDGFSGADMKQLCHEASMGPIRSISMEQMEHIDVNDVRPVNYSDFESAMIRVRASVSPDDLLQYIKWDRTYGSGAPNI